MYGVGFLQPACDQISGCVHGLVTQTTEFVSDVASRISALAQEVWKTIDEYYQFVDDLILRLENGVVSFIRNGLSSLTARFVLYSLNELTGEENKEEVDTNLAELNRAGSEAKIERFPTTEQASLSCLQLSHDRTKNPQQKTVVYFPANFEIWQGSIKYLRQLHEDTQANVHAINYRGTGGSDGFPEVEETLIDDGIAYIRKLIDKDKVPPGQIVLFGGSIGAAVAIRIAAKLADNGEIVNVAPARSFKSLESMIQTTFPFCANFVARFAANMHWKLDVQEDLKKLAGSLICLYSDQDPIVPPSVSVKAAIDAAPAGSLKLKKVDFIKMDEGEFAVEYPQYANDPDINPHIRPFTNREQTELVRCIKSLWENTEEGA